LSVFVAERYSHNIVLLLVTMQIISHDGENHKDCRIAPPVSNGYTGSPCAISTFSETLDSTYPVCRLVVSCNQKMYVNIGYHRGTVSNNDSQRVKTLCLCWSAELADQTIKCQSHICVPILLFRCCTTADTWKVQSLVHANARIDLLPKSWSPQAAL
jgi:hypothetical protein